MIDPGSRYASLAETPLSWTDAVGRERSYLPRRFLARAETFELLADVGIQGGDRLDLVAARTLGTAEAWWRIADANETLNPARLVERPAAEALAAVADPGHAAAPPAARLRVPVPRM
jgi:hypothetical protein